MFYSPEYTHNVSLHLSKVLDDIGVNEKTLTKRRKTFLTHESLYTLTERVRGRNETIYYFGSQTEGTTTMGLHPDTDVLVCNEEFNIIQDLGEWQPGLFNLLMVRDDDTPPGYCLLQKTYDNVPRVADYVSQDLFVQDGKGRVLMRNTWFVDFLPEGCERHGPSQKTRGLQGVADQDLIYAYRCKSWPADATPWLQKPSIGSWPSAEMRQSAVNDGCFVVPVSSRESLDDEFQWRISTSLTERTLMFSLNMTQIRCYVLMKMILKSFPDLESEHRLSSFICKTVLLKCIGDTNADFWQEHNLLSCFHICLNILYHCICFVHCPHFIIPGNNLMVGHISTEVRPLILDIIGQFIQSEGKILLEIETDHLGHRLLCQLSSMHVPAFFDLYPVTYRHLLHNFTMFQSARTKDVLSELTYSSTEIIVKNLFQTIHRLARVYSSGDEFLQSACKLLTKDLCTSVGSVLASHSISINRTLPQEALVWFSTDLTTGISERLKLASMFYNSGDKIRTEFILKDIEDRYNLENVLSICGCHQSKLRRNFITLSADNDGYTVIDSLAFCVRFLPSEINCIPEELQHELARSQFDALPSDRSIHDNWMDWAVVDSIPYLYFLQYKVYSHLGNPEKQQTALANLTRVIERDQNIGHPETALNILGQCLEEENRLHDALICYTESSNVRSTNNAANIYICQVLHKIHG